MQISINQSKNLKPRVDGKNQEGHKYRMMFREQYDDGSYSTFVVLMDKWQLEAIGVGIDEVAEEEEWE